ncbi:Disease resistance protein RPS4B [Cardamine amara subsp. amara]|uniref:Disease resistance protein RPS4B n=1 Tax=Cardamine amara subsp. amara TaxID=228776 RepID=A0ABD0ZLB4_CARAN
MVLAIKGTAPPQHQVFISFRGSDIRHNFFSFLKDALIKNGINVVTDEDAPRGKPIDENLLKLIRDSRIAVVIFSENYPESTWCLDELVEIEKRMELKMLDSCPIFFEVETCHVKLFRQEDEVLSTTIYCGWSTKNEKRLRRLVRRLGRMQRRDLKDGGELWFRSHLAWA